jgi:hypothetical protein
LVEGTKPETVILDHHPFAGAVCFGIDFEPVDGVCGLLLGIDAEGPFAAILNRAGERVRVGRMAWSEATMAAVRAVCKP